MDILLALVHWLHTLGLALWIGSLTMLLHVLRGRRARPEDVGMLERARARSSIVALWAVVALLVTLAIEVCVNALTMAGGDIETAFGAARLRALLFDSRYGVASVAQWLLLVASLWAAGEFGRARADAPRRAPRPNHQALGIVAPVWRPRVWLSRDAWLRVSAILAVGVLLAAAAGAAAASPDGAAPLTTAIAALRLAATALWLGGTIVLAVAVVPFVSFVESGRRPMALLTRLNRFTPIALLSIVILVATGLWDNAHAGTVEPRPGLDSRVSLLATVANVAIPIKMALFLVIIAVSVWSLLGPRRRLQQITLRVRRVPSLAPRRDALLRIVRRAVAITAGLAALALLCGAVADLYPQQGQAAATGLRDPRAASARAGATTVLLRANPIRSEGGAASLIDIDLSDATGAPVNATTVTVTAHSLEARALTMPSVTATHVGVGHYRVRVPLLAGGRWRLMVAVRRGASIATALFALTAPTPAAPPTATATAISRPAPSVYGWREVGPVLITHALVAAPDNHALLYEGTVEGVYRSTDGGTHWTAASDGLSEAAREVWSLTFLPDHSLVAATGGGIYRSTDGGAHWTAAGLETHAIYTLAAHLAGHIVLLAGGDGGVYRSDNIEAGTGNARWRQVYDSGAAAVTSLAWPAARPALVVAGINPGAGAHGPRPVIMSDDGGASWTARARGLPSGASALSAAVAPGVRVVYLGTLDAGVYVTPVTQEGTAWQGRGAGLPAAAQVGSFSFDPARPATLYAATNDGVYRSTDGGVHWNAFGAGLSGDATVVTALTLISGTHPVLYAATAAGLYRYGVDSR